jgi:hypothetical protein
MAVLDGRGSGSASFCFLSRLITGRSAGRIAPAPCLMQPIGRE